MGLQHVRWTLGCTDLPKHEITGIDVTEHTTLALLMNMIFQVVDVGIDRGSNFKWRRISFDKTPKRDVIHRGRMRQVVAVRVTSGIAWCSVEGPEARAVTRRSLPFFLMLNAGDGRSTVLHQ
jgi:hypothetical protein